MAGPSIADGLSARGVTRHVVVPPDLWALLGALKPAQALPPSGDASGELTVEAGGALPLPGVPTLTLVPQDLLGFALSTPPDGSFRVDLTPRQPISLPSELIPARLDAATDRLEPTGATAAEVVADPGGGPAIGIRIAGPRDGVATLRLVAPGADDSLTTLRLEGADGVLLDDSGFGLDLGGGLVVDDSPTEAPPPPGAGADQAHYPSTAPSWRGIAVRGARLLLPESTPFAGGAALAVDLDLGSPGGIAGRVRAHVPAGADGPEIDATVEWHDPVATSLATAVPTLVELAVKLPVDGETMPTPAGGPVAIELAGGDPIVLRGRYSHDPQGGDLRFDLAVDGVGPKGLVSITVGDQAGDAAKEVAKFCVTAAALAKAFVAESDTPSGEFPDATGVGLAVLLAAAEGLSDFCADGSLVVHGVAIEGDARAAATELSLRVDYSAGLQVSDFEAGPIKIGMRDKAPLRVRYRDVRLKLNLDGTGADRFALSFAGAGVDVEDPGGWRVEPSGPIGLSVAGTRSGHGSTWFEVDLRLAVDLGPVKVSGATVRGTLTGDPNNPIRSEIHGFDVELDVPGVIEGSGGARFGANSLDADLAARIVPLGIGGFASVKTREENQLRMVFVELGLDLPGAIPLANTGLGIYGLSGSFGYNAGLPPHNPANDPIDEMIAQRPLTPVPKPGMLLGFGLVVGTVPDLGYAFSALGSLAVATPSLDLRVGLESRFLAERPLFADISETTGSDVGVRIIGLLEKNPNELLIALRGTFKIPHLLEVTVPVVSRFPFAGPDWWVHVGSDGANGRIPEPVSVKVLPDLLGLGGSGYVMVRGDGVPNLGGSGVNLGGFSVGLGIAFHAVLGAYPIVYGEISASVMVGLGSDPLLMLGRAGVAGSLHLGPFSLGLSADLDVQIGPDVNGETVRWLHVHVCGEIDLFFTSISGCVDIDIGDRDDSVPPPDADPLTGIALTDGAGAQIESASEDPNDLPEVWPDVMPVVQFSTGPQMELTGGAFKESLVDKHMGAESAGDGRYGSADLAYQFFLTGLELERIDENGVAHPVAGPKAATWQLPRHGDPLATTKLGGARDLALLTRERHSWMRVLNDGGKGLPHDPLVVLGGICDVRFDAAPGWALGGDARDDYELGVWHLPPERPFWLSRHPSQFSVDVSLRWKEAGQLGPLWGGSMPSPFPWELGGAAPLPGPVEIAGRQFSGALTLPSLIGVPIDDAGNPDPNAAGDVGPLGDPPPTATLAFSERLEDTLLVLMVHRALLDRVAVRGDPGEEPWELVDAADVADEMILASFAPGRSGSSWEGARISYRPFASTLVLGVRGVTAPARDGATAGSGALDGSAQEQTDVATSVTPGPSRDLLEPGTRYRLTVSQRWEGRRGSGPVTGGSWPDRQFQFRTASARSNPPDVLSIARPILMRDWSSFDPAYLERYLAGYTPGDHTRDWFLQDPVAAHFRFDHVAELAKRYKRDLTVWVRRTDTPPGTPDDQGQVFVTLLWMQKPSLLYTVDSRLALLAANPPGECRIPTAGGSVGGKPLLEPLGTYDLSVRFPPQGVQPSAADRALPGIVFTTSRFGRPQDLLGAFGTARDVPVLLAGIGGTAVGDAALEAALAQLGLAGRAQPRDPTASALWARAGDGWLLAGVLLESPEPLERPGPPPSEADPAPAARLKLDGVSCPGGAFGASRRNVSATRVLYLSPAPFPPTGDLTITAVALAPLSPLGTAPTSISVTCRLARSPVFALDRVIA